MGDFGAVAANQTLSREQRVSGAQFRKGVTAPTDATIGTTPTVPALLFDATAELATAVLEKPQDWEPATDITLVILWALVNVQVNNDTLDITCNYTAPTLTTAGGFGKASTGITGQVTAVTGRLAIGDLYEMTLTFAQGDATNPLTNAVAIAAEINMTNLTGVAAAHLLGATMRYEASR